MGWRAILNTEALTPGGSGLHGEHEARVTPMSDVNPGDAGNYQRASAVRWVKV